MKIRLQVSDGECRAFEEIEVTAEVAELFDNPVEGGFNAIVDETQALCEPQNIALLIHKLDRNIWYEQLKRDEIDLLTLEPGCDKIEFDQLLYNRVRLGVTDGKYSVPYFWEFYSMKEAADAHVEWKARGYKGEPTGWNRAWSIFGKGFRRRPELDPAEEYEAP